MCAVHVEDAARAYASCVTHKNARGAYNVVGQNGVTGKDIADITARKLQCKTESVSLEEALKLFSDIPVVAMVLSTNNQAGNSKALRELGWKPQHTRIQEEL